MKLNGNKNLLFFIRLIAVHFHLHSDPVLDFIQREQKFNSVLVRITSIEENKTKLLNLNHKKKEKQIHSHLFQIFKLLKQ
jgi:hypothetical protein